MAALDTSAGLSGRAGGSRVASYIWEPPGNQRRISLDLDVVDQVLADAVRGLGSVPRRGAEVGGVLLGRMLEDGTLAITKAVPVPCAHAQGSSYTLSNDEFKKMTSTAEQFAPGHGRLIEAVGFYRSHTRDGLGLSLDDVRIFDTLFPGPAPVILLVKPAISRVSIGGFFFREEGGVRRDSSYMEFPFRRRDLAGPEPEAADEDEENTEEQAHYAAATTAGVVSKAGSGSEALKAGATGRKAKDGLLGLDGSSDKDLTADDGSVIGGGINDSSTQTPKGAKPGAKRAEQGAQQGKDRRWGLLPLSFLFLLLGMFLGLQTAVTFAPRFVANAFSIGLRAAPVAHGASRVQIYWNTSSVAVSLAQDGTLYIDDGGLTKAVPLTRDQLLAGQAVYPPVNDHVRFRLDIRVRNNASFSETVEYDRR